MFHMRASESAVSARLVYHPSLDMFPVASDSPSEYESEWWEQRVFSFTCGDVLRILLSPLRSFP